jgi:NAD(P)-dependent dehydrogenase (short-subunit alcohol dehydrogenase family)
MQAMPSLHGRRAIVSGANGGIGFHTALELALWHARPTRSGMAPEEDARRGRRRRAVATLRNADGRAIRLLPVTARLAIPESS